MNPYTQDTKALALESAARLLKHAADAMELNVPHPIFKKTITVNIGGIKRKCIQHIVMPGIVRLYDPDTNELLAESAPGQLGQLAPGFIPPGWR